MIPPSHKTDTELLYSPDYRHPNYDTVAELKEFKKRPNVLSTMFAMVGMDGEYLVSRPLGRIIESHTPVAQMTDTEVASFSADTKESLYEKIQAHQKEYSKRFGGSFDFYVLPG